MEQNSEIFGLQVDPVIKSYLAETAKWGRFLSILGFILCGLIVLIGIFAGSIFSMFGSATIGGESPIGASGFASVMVVLYILIALLYFFPCLYLFRFSNKMKTALYGNSQEDLTESFQNLKSLFKFVGILTIIILAIYALIFFIGILGVASSR